MRKLLSLIALFCVMAIGAGVSVSSANAATLTSAVQLQAQQTGVAEKAYYRRGYHRGYYNRVIAVIIVVVTAIIVAMAAIIIAVAGGGIMAIATAVAGTRTSAIDHHSEASGSGPGAFNIFRGLLDEISNNRITDRGFYDRSGLCGTASCFARCLSASESSSAPESKRSISGPRWKRRRACRLAGESDHSQRVGNMVWPLRQRDTVIG